MVRVWLTMLFTCCFGLSSVRAQEGAATTESMTVDSAFAEQLLLPLPLQALPPSTSFFLAVNDADRFRETFARRVTRLLTQEADAEKWRVAGLRPARQLVSELLGMDVSVAYPTFTGHFVVGRTDPGQWFIVAERPMSDSVRDEDLSRLFDQGGLHYKVHQQDCLIGASSLQARAAVWTMLAFPSTLAVEQVALKAYRGAEAADHPEDIYRFWLQLPAQAGAVGSEADVWGRARWDDAGIHQHAELIAGATSGTLDALFADTNGAFRSFALLPEQPLTVLAARFRSSPALYDALVGWKNAPLFVQRVMAQVTKAAETARIDLRGGLLANLGGEWAFATLAGQGKDAPWLLLMEVGDLAAVDRFLERFAQGLGSQAARRAYGSLTGLMFTVNGRSFHVCRLGNFLALSNSSNALQAALEASQGAGSFESSLMLSEAKQRLAANGVFYSFHHSLACLTQLADQATFLKLDQPWYFTYPPGAADLSLLERPGLRAPDVYANDKFWGCAQIKRSPRGLTLEAHSTTGLGPLEMTAAAMFAPLLQARYDALLLRTHRAMADYADALREYWRRTNQLPRVNDEYEIDPPEQLRLPLEAGLDPYAKAKRQLLVFMREGRFIVVSRGPDRDLDLELDHNFDPWAEYQLQNAAEQIYWLELRSTYDGDLVLPGRFQTPASPGGR